MIREVKAWDMEAIQMANSKIDEIRTEFCIDWLHAQKQWALKQPDRIKQRHL